MVFYPGRLILDPGTREKNHKAAIEPRLYGPILQGIIIAYVYYYFCFFQLLANVEGPTQAGIHFHETVTMCFRCLNLLTSNACVITKPLFCSAYCEPSYKVVKTQYGHGCLTLL